MSILKGRLSKLEQVNRPTEPMIFDFLDRETGGMVRYFGDSHGGAVVPLKLADEDADLECS